MADLQRAVRAKFGLPPDRQRLLLLRRDDAVVLGMPSGDDTLVAPLGGAHLRREYQLTSGDEVVLEEVLPGQSSGAADSAVVRAHENARNFVRVCFNRPEAPEDFSCTVHTDLRLTLGELKEEMARYGHGAARRRAPQRVLSPVIGPSDSLTLCGARRRVLELPAGAFVLKRNQRAPQLKDLHLTLRCAARYGATRYGAARCGAARYAAAMFRCDGRPLTAAPLRQLGVVDMTALFVQKGTPLGPDEFLIKFMTFDPLNISKVFSPLCKLAVKAEERWARAASRHGRALCAARPLSLHRADSHRRHSIEAVKQRLAQRLKHDASCIRLRDKRLCAVGTIFRDDRSVRKSLTRLEDGREVHGTRWLAA